MTEGVVGFIGGGQMTTAIVNGLLRKMEASKLVVFDRNEPKMVAFRELGVTPGTSPNNVVQKSSVIVLSVKPYALVGVLQQIKNDVTKDKTIVSVAAGVPISVIAKELPEGTGIIRVMPNTPCLIGEGLSAISPGEGVERGKIAEVVEIFSSLGKALEIQEKHLDAVTGLSGSGPAYVFLFIEALADGGVKSGLPRDIALALAAQVVRGASGMVVQTGVHPAVLKDRVASPGGTTIYGVDALEKNAFRGTVMNAVYSACERSKELSKN